MCVHVYALACVALHGSVCVSWQVTLSRCFCLSAHLHPRLHMATYMFMWDRRVSACPWCLENHLYVPGSARKSYVCHLNTSGHTRTSDHGYNCVWHTPEPWTCVSPYFNASPRVAQVPHTSRHLCGLGEGVCVSIRLQVSLNMASHQYVCTPPSVPVALGLCPWLCVIVAAVSPSGHRLAQPHGSPSVRLHACARGGVFQGVCVGPG